MSTELIKGVLTATTHTMTVFPPQPPWTFSLASTSGTRKIELSVDGGATFFEPGEYDKEDTGLLVLSASAPVSHVKFTGVIGNAWGMLS